MKTCEKCGHEYIDAYEECPFCKRIEASEIPQAPEAKHVERSGISVFVWLIVAILVIVACAAASTMFASSSSSTVSDPRVIELAPEATAQEQCFAIQQSIEQAAVVREARFGEITEYPQELAPKYLASIPACPEQGEYTLIWEARLPRCECSVHGWHGDQ